MHSPISSVAHRLHVLVVDANPELCIIVSTVLTDEGYRVQTVGDGRAALDIMRASGTRLLVLLGLRLPYVTGLAVLEAVAANPALARRHAIIMMTGAIGLATHGRVKVLCDQLGIALLAKPFSLQQLLDAVAVAS